MGKIHVLYCKTCDDITKSKRNSCPKCGGKYELITLEHTFAHTIELVCMVLTYLSLFGSLYAISQGNNYMVVASLINAIFWTVIGLSAASHNKRMSIQNYRNEKKISSPTNVRMCVKCGRSIAFNAMFCEHCGHSYADARSNQSQRDTKKARLCFKCKKVIPDDAKLCPYCGKKCRKFCSKCKREIPTDANLCPYCGNKQSIGVSQKQGRKNVAKREISPQIKKQKKTMPARPKPKPIAPPPPPLPTITPGLTKKTGVCQQCGSRNITVYDDGSGMCNVCKKVFM